MRMPALSDRDRRAVLWGGPMLLAGLLWMTVLSPYLHRVTHLSERLTEERRLLVGERALLAATPIYTDTWEQASARLMDAAERLFGGELEEARGAVVHYLEGAAGMSRVLVERVEPDPPVEVEPGIVGLPVRMRGETDYEGLATLLSLLEDGKRLVRVDELRVQGPAGGLLAAGGYESLTFELTASGYLLALPDSDESVRVAVGDGPPGGAEVGR